jgi:hypothetical protein
MKVLLYTGNVILGEVRVLKIKSEANKPFNVAIGRKEVRFDRISQLEQKKLDGFSDSVVIYKSEI